MERPPAVLRNVAVTELPLWLSETILPEHGRRAFHRTASSCVSKCVAMLPWTTTASRSNSDAARSLSSALSASLHARTTSRGPAAARSLPPQPASRSRRTSTSAGASRRKIGRLYDGGRVYVLV